MISIIWGGLYFLDPWMTPFFYFSAVTGLVIGTAAFVGYVYFVLDITFQETCYVLDRQAGTHDAFLTFYDLLSRQNSSELVREVVGRQLRKKLSGDWTGIKPEVTIPFREAGVAICIGAGFMVVFLGGGYFQSSDRFMKLIHRPGSALEQSEKMNRQFVMQKEKMQKNQEPVRKRKTDSDEKDRNRTRVQSSTEKRNDSRTDTVQNQDSFFQEETARDRSSEEANSINRQLEQGRKDRMGAGTNNRKRPVIGDKKQKRGRRKNRERLQHSPNVEMERKSETIKRSVKKFGDGDSSVPSGRFFRGDSATEIQDVSGPKLVVPTIRNWPDGYDRSIQSYYRYLRFEDHD